MLNNYDGGYAKDDTDATVIFMYIKMTDKELEKSLPLSYVKNSDCKNQYLVVIFKDGFDYLGQSTYDNLQSTIKELHYKSIFDNDYKFIKTHFPDVTEKEYNSTKSIIQEQINYIEDKREKAKNKKSCCCF